MKLRKWKALLMKDVKLVLKNKNIVLLLLLPILFSFIYSSLFEEMTAEVGPYGLLSMITGLGLMVIGSSVMAMSISEEKEKKTLRSLLLSDVSASEFIISKMMIVLVLFTLVMIGCYLIVGSPLSYLPEYIVIIMLTTVSLLFISSIIGILSPSQQAAGILATPIMLILGVPLFSMMGHNELLLTIAKFIPTGPALFLINVKSGMIENYASLLGYCSMVVWIVISLGLFTYFYKKNSMDN